MHFTFGAVATTSALCSIFVQASPLAVRNAAQEDPFKVLDAQNWVNPDNMTWADYQAPPGTNWSDPSRQGSIRNFRIALVTVDYPDMPFTITQPAGSTVFGNPLPILSDVPRENVTAWYHNRLNVPNDLNKGHTLHEYWMEDSEGRFGVDLVAFGAYRLPQKSFQYGVDDGRGGLNPGACPLEPCAVDLRTDALGAWRADVGNQTAGSFELAFILSAGQDESSTWQEFGEMKFLTREDVPEEFGPPNNETLPNYAKTRYVDWTSWASASTIWPNAGGGSSTQAESSGTSTFAHELSHLLGIGDNYNNPYGVPARRSYTGPWSMMSRGSFNGPGGPHTRWEIPALQGGSLGSEHTIRDKIQLGLVDNSSIPRVSREDLADSGLVVAQLTARSVVPSEAGLKGLRITMGSDLSPKCNVSAEPLCDGGGFNNYDMEVVDRMGADSFTPDSGVMISKTKDSDRTQPFQWTIDANPQDINVIDFYRPDGTPSYLTVGDYRQLADALFHAGTRSGSEFEYIDKANSLHLYVLDVNRDTEGVLHYVVGARSLDASESGRFGVKLGEGQVADGSYKKADATATTCTFELTNSGSSSNSTTASKYANSDIYRLSATVEGSGWRVEVPNALAFAEFGQSTTAKVAVGATEDADSGAVVKLTVTSESDESVTATKECAVSK